MGTWLAVALLGVVLWWLLAPRRRTAAAEGDVTTSIDQEALAEAERELQQDTRPRSIEQGLDDDPNDWGPGTR